MIQFFCGRNGSGKTYRIYQHIKAEENLSEVILIVPDQSTFQHERKMLNELGTVKASQIKIFSFKRLYEYLSEQYGEHTKHRIDDGAKAVLMSIAAEQVADRLKLYANRVHKADFAELMLNAVNEYKLCAIKPERLSETAVKVTDEHLKEKLKESAMVYSAYEALVNAAYTDPDDDLTRLYEILCRHDFFRGKRVYIDAFNGFSGQEYKIVEMIMEQADYAGITLGFDGLVTNHADNSIFKEPYMTMQKLTAFANDNGIAVLPTIRLAVQRRFRNPSLGALEESLFRFDGDVYDYNDNAVSLYESESEYDEIQQTARTICHLVREENYSYNDITIIAHDIEMYRHIIDTEFQKYHIPFFMSDKKSLEGNSLVRLIVSAFDIIHSSFATENILTFLKTELTNLQPQEICTLENYVYMWDIRGRRWTEPFTMNPNGNVMTEESEENQDKSYLQELSAIETMRQNIMTPLLEFAKAISSPQNGGEICVAVYNLLDSIGAKKRLYGLAKWFHDNGNIKAQEAEVRTWNITMEILDKMYHIFKDKKVDSKQYLEMLKLMIKKSPVSDIPQTLDQVTIGLSGNLITEQPKAVFIIGAIDGIFPAAIQPTGLFSDAERNQLIALELPLHNALYDASLHEKYDVYTAVSAPSEKLYVSYHYANAKGEKLKPSVIFKEIQAILANVTLKDRSMLSLKELCYTEQQAFEECAAHWHDDTPEYMALKQYFENHDDFRAVCTAINKAVMDEPYRISDRKKARQLFGENIHLSASQAEVYYSCPFAYFCQYGLRVFPRKRASVDSAMYGSVAHYVLENILRDKSFDELKQCDVSQMSHLVRTYLESYIQAIGGKEERMERFMVQFQMMERNLVIVLKRLIDEFEVCQFRPESFELKIGGKNPDIPEYELQLPSGEKISVTGKIDRVDTYVKGNEKYIRIIDYKTGKKIFKLSDVYYGLNMQMLLYLSAVSRNGNDKFNPDQKYHILAPAGILYMPSTPQSETQDFNSQSNKQKNADEQTKNFRMSGLLIKDKEILSAMETGIQGIYIPADGDIDKCKNLATLEEYGKIFRYIDEKLQSMASSLFDGNVERNPVKSSFDACQYCNYRQVCGYEKGKKCNRTANMSNAEILKKMGEDNHG